MKHFNQVRKFGAKVSCAVGAVLLPVVSFATPGTYDGITSAVDFAEVATAVVAIAALIAVALVARKGARMVLGMIGR